MAEAQVARVAAGPKVREWARRNGFSDWMVARWLRLVEEPGTFLGGLLRPPPPYIRVNPLRTDVDTLRVRLEARGFEVARTDLDPNVLRIHHAPVSPGATHEHLLGHTTPQDLASVAAPLALQAGSAETIVDLAAAPGVKTLHVAGDMENQGAIVAVEPEQRRMRALRFNLERAGVQNALLVQADGRDPALRPDDAPWADRILLDAPCTGEGTIPKDRSRRRGTPEEIGRAAALQSDLLDAADTMLRPGGRIVYATCTFAPEENEVQVQRLLDRGYRMVDLPFDSCGGVPLAPAVTDWPGYAFDADIAKARRFLPGIHPTLGFFVAALEKPRRDD